MTKRKFLTKILFALCMVCLAFAFSLSLLNTKKTLADENLPTVTDFSMMEGAQVRKESGTVGSQTALQKAKGIRFRMYVNQTYFDSLTEPEVGIYVALASEATESDMKDMETAEEKAKFKFTETDKAKLVALAAGEETQEAVYVLNAVVVGLPETDYNTALIANGYVKEGETATLTAEPQTRSVAQVASLALIDGDGTTEKDPFGTLNHYVDTVATADNFKFANTAIMTDKYKTAEPTIGATLPKNLTAKWTSSNEEVATVDANGNITRVGLGETEITATLGTTVQTATLTVGAPAPLKITGEADGNMIFTPNGVKYQYVGANSEELNNITGDYNGAALKHDAGGNGLHNLYSAYTKEELTEIAKDYNKVTFWFAINGGVNKTGASGFIRHYYKANDAVVNSVENLALGLTGNKDYSIADGGKWTKWTLSINDYISLLTEEVKDEEPTGKSYVSLYWAWAYNFTTNPNMYLGDVEFVFDPYIVKVDESAQNKITKGTTNGKLAGSVIDGFEGDYDGEAISFLDARSKDYRVANPYTLEQLEALKTKYSKVSMWIAMDNIGTTGSFQMHTNPSSGARQCFLNKVYSNDKNAIASFTNATNNKWFKYSVSIDDYISLITTTTGAGTDSETVTVHDYFLIANPDVSGSTTSITDVNGDGTCNYKDVTLYVGDIFFE